LTRGEQKMKLMNVNNQFLYGERTEETKNIGMDIADVIISSGGAKTKSEARRLITGGGFKIFDQKVLDPFARLSYDSERKMFILFEDFSFYKDEE